MVLDTIENRLARLESQSKKEWFIYSSSLLLQKACWRGGRGGWYTRNIPAIGSSWHRKLPIDFSLVCCDVCKKQESTERASLCRALLFHSSSGLAVLCNLTNQPRYCCMQWFTRRFVFSVQHAADDAQRTTSRRLNPEECEWILWETRRLPFTAAAACCCCCCCENSERLTVSAAAAAAVQQVAGFIMIIPLTYTAVNAHDSTPVWGRINNNRRSFQIFSMKPPAQCLSCSDSSYVNSLCRLARDDSRAFACLKTKIKITIIGTRNLKVCLVTFYCCFVSFTTPLKSSNNTIKPSLQLPWLSAVIRHHQAQPIIFTFWFSFVFSNFF